MKETPEPTPLPAGHDALAAMNLTELEALAERLRRRLVEVVSRQGGHLASNLGVVELSIALHRVFRSPRDRILWDVGHQSYAHKLLTGRDAGFDSLRAYGGMSGFPQPCESPHDPFIAGHAGNAISAALGISAAFEQQRRDDKVVAVVGDGAFGCGISLEGLNNIAMHGRHLVIILNDNKMSISSNVGAISSHLTRLLAGRRYNRLKKLLKSRLPGKKPVRFLSLMTDLAKRLLMPASIFEELGVRYLGPIDGHNLGDLLHTLEATRDFDYPVLIHVVTEKGRGYAPAAAQPDKFHGIGPFDPATGEAHNAAGNGFTDAFGQAVVELAAQDPALNAITAGMTSGTGLGAFAERFPERFFDVGIAEEHAVIFAGGLAAAGLKPVTAIYSTFLTRAFDCVFHDVCLQKLPVVFAVDRAGAVEDGPTHHGIYDLSFLRTQPALTILAPADPSEVAPMLAFALALNAPAAIRYPRGTARQIPAAHAPIVHGRAEVLLEGRDGVIWALGGEVARACDTAERIRERFGLEVGVVNVRFVRPLDAELLRRQAAQMPVFTLEDHLLAGGLGSAVVEELNGRPQKGVLTFGWKTAPGHGAVECLRQAAGLLPEQLAETIGRFVTR